MQKHLITIGLLMVSTSALAQSNANSNLSNASDSGAFASTGSITFEASEQRGTINTTPPIYVAPSMFAPGTCGMSDTATVGVSGFGFGGSKSKESDYCNARQDTGTAYNLGYKDVAAMRFFCFGSDENRMAFEASGHTCPATATAKGLNQKTSAPSSAQIDYFYGPN